MTGAKYCLWRRKKSNWAPPWCYLLKNNSSACSWGEWKGRNKKWKAFISYWVLFHSLRTLLLQLWEAILILSCVLGHLWFQIPFHGTVKKALIPSLAYQLHCSRQEHSLPATLLMLVQQTSATRKLHLNELEVELSPSQVEHVNLFSCSHLDMNNSSALSQLLLSKVKLLFWLGGKKNKNLLPAQQIQFCHYSWAQYSEKDWVCSRPWRARVLQLVYPKKMQTSME